MHNVCFIQRETTNFDYAHEQVVSLGMKYEQCFQLRCKQCSSMVPIDKPGNDQSVPLAITCILGAFGIQG